MAKILIAEDEKALALSLSLKLTNAGFEVVSAIDGVDTYSLKIPWVPLRWRISMMC